MITNTMLMSWQAPRAEALSILGALLSFPSHLGDFPVLGAGSDSPSVVDCFELKNQLLEGLLHSAKKEPAGLAR